MDTSGRTIGTTRFVVRNVGGIDEAEVDLRPGVTVLTGENATNRTSFLQAVMAAMGSDRATLKGDADEGRVEMELDGETYERTLSRAGDDVRFSGEGYLSDPAVADLFAFLLETNEARRSVARGDDLREVIMRPIDSAAIEERITELKRRKDEVAEELDRIESRRRDLPDLERRRDSLRERIEAKREELAEKEAEIDTTGRGIEESRNRQEHLEGKLDDLRATRSELESVRREIETQQESIASLEDEREELEAERDALPNGSATERRDLEAEIDRLRTRRQELNEEISELQRLVQYNEERLDGANREVLRSLDGSTATDADGSITDRLVDEGAESVVCWTCGSTVDRKRIEDTVDRLGSLREKRIEELDEVKSRLQEAKSDLGDLEEKRRRREEVTRKLDETDDELERRRERLESLEGRRDELTGRVETLEGEVEEFESEEFDEVLALHREANEIEFEIDGLETDLEEVVAEMERIEGEVERAETLREEREELTDQLERERTRIDRIEAEAVEEFNEHMDAILGLLGYTNLDRIWIERKNRTVREGRRKVERTAFDLHVIRTTADGTAYEDTVEHLSESEREVTGLVFALAGYLVHDLHESVPFMLLDSLEAIDAERIASLVEYFAEYAGFLVVALLPEDARALDDGYHRVEEIGKQIG